MYICYYLVKQPMKKITLVFCIFIMMLKTVHSSPVGGWSLSMTWMGTNMFNDTIYINPGDTIFAVSDIYNTGPCPFMPSGFSWTLNGSSITPLYSGGATTGTYFFTQAGTYILSTPYSSTYTKTFTVIWNTPLDISNMRDVPNVFQIFPNPSKDIFNITSLEKISNIEVLNIIGQTIYSSEIDSLNAFVNIGDKPKGIYFLRITIEKNAVYSQKIVLVN